MGGLPSGLSHGFVTKEKLHQSLSFVSRLQVRIYNGSVSFSAGLFFRESLADNFQAWNQAKNTVLWLNTEIVFSNLKDNR